MCSSWGDFEPFFPSTGELDSRAVLPSCLSAEEGVPEDCWVMQPLARGVSSTFSLNG